MNIENCANIRYGMIGGLSQCRICDQSRFCKVIQNPIGSISCGDEPLCETCGYPMRFYLLGDHKIESLTHLDMRNYEWQCPGCHINRIKSSPRVGWGEVRYCVQCKVWHLFRTRKATPDVEYCQKCALGVIIRSNGLYEPLLIEEQKVEIER